MDLSPKGLERAIDVFKKCVGFEVGFWEMGLRGPVGAAATAAGQEEGGVEGGDV